MRRIKNTALFHCLLLAAAGCGGGGGGGDTSGFAGFWDVSLSVVRNTCPFGAVNASGGLFEFNQVDDEIAVEGAFHFAGFVTSESTFIATGQENVDCVDSRTNQPTGNVTVLVRTFNFEQTDSDNGRVEITAEYADCPGGADSSCEIVAQGIAQRTER